MFVIQVKSIFLAVPAKVINILNFARDSTDVISTIIMSLRTILTALCGYHRIQLKKSYTKLQKCSFYAHLQRLSADVKNLESQNLKLITTTWVERLKEEDVPEAELSVKFITEHVLGKERARVCMCDIGFNGERKGMRGGILGNPPPPRDVPPPPPPPGLWRKPVSIVLGSVDLNVKCKS